MKKQTCTVCAKEGEWSSMAERIKAVEVKQDTTIETIKDLRGDLKDFINKADDRYATKAEVKSVEDKIAVVNKNQDEKLQFIYGKTWKLTKDLSTLAGAVALVTKLLGFW